MCAWAVDEHHESRGRRMVESIWLHTYRFYCCLSGRASDLAQESPSPVIFFRFIVCSHIFIYKTVSVCPDDDGCASRRACFEGVVRKTAQIQSNLARAFFKMFGQLVATWRIESMREGPQSGALLMYISLATLALDYHTDCLWFGWSPIMRCMSRVRIKTSWYDLTSFWLALRISRFFWPPIFRVWKCWLEIM